VPLFRVVRWMKSDGQPVDVEATTKEMDDEIPF
jgi:hypothetical protein